MHSQCIPKKEQYVPILLDTFYPEDCACCWLLLMHFYINHPFKAQVVYSSVGIQCKLHVTEKGGSCSSRLNQPFPLHCSCVDLRCWPAPLDTASAGFAQSCTNSNSIAREVGVRQLLGRNCCFVSQGASTRHDPPSHTQRPTPRPALPQTSAISPRNSLCTAMLHQHQ